MTVKREIILEIESLDFEYRDEKILMSISTKIYSNEITVIAGKNGSGKSTLAKILVGLEKPSGGKIILDGKAVDFDHLEDVREKVSLVFQNPNNQIIGTKVIDDLAFALENRGISREKMIERIRELAEELDIQHLLHKDPAELSGGQKQLIAIAGILIYNPKIIILDEITSMLDMISKKKIISLIEKLKRNHTIILISHDSDELISSDRIIYLEKGKVLLDEKPEIFYSDYKFLKEREIELPFLIEVKKNLEESGKEREIIDRCLERLR